MDFSLVKGRGVARNISQGGRHKNSREGRLLSERNMDCLDSREILLFKKNVPKVTNIINVIA